MDKAPPHEAPFSIIFQILVFFAFIFSFGTYSTMLPPMHYKFVIYSYFSRVIYGPIL